jgi:hypothetical protein
MAIDEKYLFYSRTSQFNFILSIYWCNTARWKKNTVCCQLSRGERKDQISYKDCVVSFFSLSLRRIFSQVTRLIRNIDVQICLINQILKLDL